MTGTARTVGAARSSNSITKLGRSKLANSLTAVLEDDPFKVDPRPSKTSASGARSSAVIISLPVPADVSITDGRDAGVAVTVVGGYLGAGKTPLLNHLLSVADERVAVLVNDFGALDIDAQLLDRSDGSTVTLPNGCICCSLADGLAAALDDLAELEPRPERVVIEASGVADPAGIAAYCHRRPYRLDLVVVLVDAAHLAAHVVDEYVGETVRSQLVSADLVVVNKADLADPDEAAQIVEIHTPGTPAVAAVEAVIDPAALIGLEPRSKPTAHLHDHGVPFETWSWSGGAISTNTARTGR